jgi:hypothetical protein
MMFRKRNVQPSSSSSSSTVGRGVTVSTEDDDDEEVIKVDRTKSSRSSKIPFQIQQEKNMKLSVPMMDSANSEAVAADDELKEEYSQKSIAQMKLSYNVKLNNEMGVEQTTTTTKDYIQPTNEFILTGEAAERMMLADDNDNDIIDIEVEGAEEKTKNDVAKVTEAEKAKPSHEISVESSSLTSSPSDSGHDDDEDEATRISPLQTETVSTFIIDLDTVLERLTSKLQDLRKDIGQSSSTTDKEKTESIKQKKHLLSIAGEKQKRFEDLRKFLKTLISCLRYQMYLLKAPSVPKQLLLSMWDNVRQEFSSAKRVAETIAWWEVEDEQTFRKTVAPSLAELFCPYVVWYILTHPEDRFLGTECENWPPINTIISCFSNDATKKLLARNVAISTLQNMSVRSEEMEETLSRLLGSAEVEKNS